MTIINLSQGPVNTRGTTAFVQLARSAAGAIALEFVNGYDVELLVQVDFLDAARSNALLGTFQGELAATGSLVVNGDHLLPSTAAVTDSVNAQYSITSRRSNAHLDEFRRVDVEPSS